MSYAAEQELKEQLDSSGIDLSNCTKCIGEEKQPDIQNLNDYQKKAYDNICEVLEQKSNSVIMINAPSGTGKTFLLRTLAKNYEKSKFITFRKDQTSNISSEGTETYTFVSFCMHHFELSYNKASQMFETSGEDGIEELYKLILYSKQFDVKDTSVLIFDIYTMPSPSMLILLYILSFKHKLHLIFAGDPMQVDPIDKSVFHMESNYYIIQILEDLTISNLNKNMRIRDPVLQDKVNDFYERLRQVQPVGNVPLNYNLRYYLYTLFRRQYLAAERFDTIYIARTHRNITERLYRYIDHLPTDTTYYEAPFYYGLNKTKFPLDSRSYESRRYKFFPTLLLVKGWRYIYINADGVHHVVRLENILLENNEIESLIIRFLKGKQDVEIIKRVILNYYQILPDYRNWLCQTNRVHKENDIWQFPLRPYTLTYHATVGRTIDEAQVELSAECEYANFLCIGLCSVRNESDIHKIRDEGNLAGFLTTEYMETLSRNEDSGKYYYHCPLNKYQLYQIIVNNKNNEYLDNITWRTINDIDTFEVEKEKQINFIRIKRSEYDKSNKKVDTQFMKITKFVKENQDVILNTIQKAPVEDFDKYCNTEKEKKKKGQQQDNENDKKSDALRDLSYQYDQWVDQKGEDSQGTKKEKDLQE